VKHQIKKLTQCHLALSQFFPSRRRSVSAPLHGGVSGDDESALHFLVFVCGLLKNGFVTMSNGFHHAVKFPSIPQMGGIGLPPHIAKFRAWARRTSTEQKLTFQPKKTNISKILVAVIP
jgi:hypothetical protein